MERVAEKGEEVSELFTRLTVERIKAKEGKGDREEMAELEKRMKEISGWMADVMNRLEAACWPRRNS